MYSEREERKKFPYHHALQSLHKRDHELQPPFLQESRGSYRDAGKGGRAMAEKVGRAMALHPHVPASSTGQTPGGKKREYAASHKVLSDEDCAPSHTTRELPVAFCLPMTECFLLSHQCAAAPHRPLL